VSGEDMLTVHERTQLARALRAGRDVSAPVGVTYFFFARGPEPVEAAAMLRDNGMRVVVDEEISGDRYWHIAAFTKVTLTASAIHQADSAMERIATQTRVRYDGWHVSLTIGEDC